MAKGDSTLTGRFPFTPKDADIRASVFHLDDGRELWVNVGKSELVLNYDKKYRGLNGELRIDIRNYKYEPVQRFNLNGNFTGTPTIEFKPINTPIILKPYGINGLNFTRDNQLVHWVGASGFQAFDKFRRNDRSLDDFLSFLKNDLQVNIIRTFLACQLLFNLNPDEYDHELVSDFSNRCNAYGLVNEFVPLVDMHAIYNNTRKEIDYRNSVSQFYDVKDFEELVNEVDQTVNNVDTNAFDQLSNLLSSHGSNGGDTGPVEPFWSFAGFHEGRNDEHVRKIKTAWEYAKARNKPVVLDELMRPDQYGYNKDEAFQMGFMSGMFGPGCTVHSDALRFANVPSGDERECLKLTLSGLSKVPPIVYNWNYGRFGPDAPATPMPVKDEGSLRTFVMMNNEQTDCYLISIKDTDGRITPVNDWMIKEDFGAQCYQLVR